MREQQSLENQKLELIQSLVSVEDPILIQRMLEMIRESKSVLRPVGYEPDGSPISQSSLIQKLTESQKEVREGKFISGEDLKAKIDSWV